MQCFFIRCGTPLIICAIYYVIYCAFVVICSTFVVICCGFAIICGAYVIIRSDFSIILTFCHSISSVLSLYRVVYALYGVRTILPRVHFALFAVLSSLYRNFIMIYPQCKARVSDPSSTQPDAAILVCFRGKVESQITPDIVANISVHEMNQLGVNNRGDMMNLCTYQCQAGAPGGGEAGHRARI